MKMDMIGRGSFFSISEITIWYMKTEIIPIINNDMIHFDLKMIENFIRNKALKISKSSQLVFMYWAPVYIQAEKGRIQNIGIKYVNTYVYVFFDISNTL